MLEGGTTHINLSACLTLCCCALQLLLHFNVKVTHSLI